MLTSTLSAFAGQAPGAAEQPDIAVSKRDRFYTSDQFSNTVSVINPASNKLLGVIRLGDPTPGNLSPLYRGQLLVHGMGFSPDHRTLLAVSIGSNSVSFIDTATNKVKHVTYVGRSPHRHFSRQTAKRFGSASVVRITSRSWMARPMVKSRASKCRMGRG
jgi:YVTN family beta-propeller protein